MKIKVRSIPAAGLPFEESVMPREIGFAEDFVNEECPLRIRGLFRHVGDFVLAKVQVICRVENHCARCLERISREQEFSYDLEFEIMPGQEYIDVGERIHEEIVLEYLPRILCRDDCLGICPGCGAELNNEKCECHAPQTAERKKPIKESGNA